MGERQQLGLDGEEMAAAYLAEHGMAVVARNWRCRYGEIDIVAREGAALVFIEVKTRRSGRLGGPLVAVTPEKVARLRRLASLWLQATGGHRGPIRIDVVGLLQRADGRYVVEHVRGVC